MGSSLISLPSQVEIQTTIQRINVKSFSETPLHVDIVNLAIDLLKSMNGKVSALGFNIVLQYPESPDIDWVPRQKIANLLNLENINKMTNAEIGNPLLRLEYEEGDRRLRIVLSCEDTDILLLRFNFHYQIATSPEDAILDSGSLRERSNWREAFMNDFETAQLFAKTVIDIGQD